MIASQDFHRAATRLSRSACQDWHKVHGAIDVKLQSRYFGPIAAVVLTLCLCAAVLV
jgi:hypothetical protein